MKGIGRVIRNISLSKKEKSDDFKLNQIFTFHIGLAFPDYSLLPVCMWPRDIYTRARRSGWLGPPFSYFIFHISDISVVIFILISNFSTHFLFLLFLARFYRFLAVNIVVQFYIHSFTVNLLLSWVQEFHLSL